MKILFARRLRLHSWKEAIIYVIIIAVLYGLKALFEKKLQNVDERIVRVIVIVVVIALTVGLMFLFDV